VAVVTGFAAPQYLLGVVAASLSFHDALVPKAGICIVALLYGRAWYRWARRWQSRIRAGGNQHTFEGVPIDELAGFLLSSGRFTREEAMERLALSQPRHKKIGSVLEQAGILVRGECNALQLRDISREQLVVQLRGIAGKKAAPLVYDKARNEWVERDGTFAHFILDRERGEAQQREKLGRLERRIKRRKEELSSLPTDGEALYALPSPAFSSRPISAL